MSYLSILKLLETKKERFIDYEKATSAMLDCEIDELEDYMKTRDNLIFEIDGIDQKVEQEWQEMADGQEVALAVKNEGNQEDFPLEIREIYDLSAQIKSVISRLFETETQVGLRLRLEQERALEMIKDNNRGNTAQVSKFLSVAEGEETKNNTWGEA